MQKPRSTEVIPTTHPRAIEIARHVLESGGLVAFPTDTVYGLGAPAFVPQGVGRIYAVKGRPRSKAIPLLLASAAGLKDVAEDIPPEAGVLAREFWPGPLTIVLKRKATLPDIVTAGGASVAVRVPDHDSTLALIEATGGELAATSANISGRPDPVTAQEVLANLGGRIELILDGGRCPGGIPSTVVDLTSRRPQILRVGAIEQETIEWALRSHAG
jgi:L-threonylcarbamoyladenylate synthase